MLHFAALRVIYYKTKKKEGVLLLKIGFGIAGTDSVTGYINALLCENSFYVITKRQLKYAQRKTKTKRPVFYADKHVYIEGINI